MVNFLNSLHLGAFLRPSVLTLFRTMCIAVLLLNAGHPGKVFSRRQTLEAKDSESPFEYLPNGTHEDISMDNMSEPQIKK